ncbi:hypothetical protein CARUB_v10012043mg, partial [Capsella rubella]
MNNDEEFLRLLNSLDNPEAHRINSEGGEDNVSRKRPAESRRHGKKNRVKRQCVTKSSDKSRDDKLLAKIKRELIRSKLEALKEVTPNCPESDINAILDCAIEYLKHLHLAILFR